MCTVDHSNLALSASSDAATVRSWICTAHSIGLANRPNKKSSTAATGGLVRPRSRPFVASTAYAPRWREERHNKLTRRDRKFRKGRLVVGVSELNRQTHNCEVLAACEP